MPKRVYITWLFSSIQNFHQHGCSCFDSWHNSILNSYSWTWGDDNGHNFCYNHYASNIVFILQVEYKYNLYSFFSWQFNISVLQKSIKDSQKNLASRMFLCRYYLSSYEGLVFICILSYMHQYFFINYLIRSKVLTSATVLNLFRSI
jgi:hypothetical protein